MAIPNFPDRAMLTLRAHQCRTIAASFHDLSTRERMLKVADDYARMAEEAERREEANQTSFPEKIDTLDGPEL